MAVSWMLAVSFAGQQRQSLPGATPNPVVESPGTLGPIETLAFADPWFAGTATFWIIPWSVVIVLFAIACVWFVQRRGSNLPVKQRLLRVTLAALGVGCVFALPWMSAGYLMMAR